MKKQEIKNLIKLKEEMLVLNEFSKKIKFNEIYQMELEHLKSLRGIEPIMDQLNSISDAFNKTKTYYDELSSKWQILATKCQHQVRLSYPGILGGQFTRCCICGTYFLENRNVVYDDPNIDKYYCSFLEDYYDDEDDYHQEGISIEDVYKYIDKILNNKTDDEEIDLVQEMKKIKPKKCTFIEKPFVNASYVLIIGGNNKHMLDGRYYIECQAGNIGPDFAKWFLGLPYTSVELIDNPENYNSVHFKEIFPYTNVSNMYFKEYEGLPELNKELDELKKHGHFNLIIDASDISSYEIKNDKIAITPQNLPLKAMFPEAAILRIVHNPDMDVQDYDMLLTYMLDKFEKNKLLYQREENGHIKEYKFDDLCNDVKRLTLKK